MAAAPPTTTISRPLPIPKLHSHTRSSFSSSTSFSVKFLHNDAAWRLTSRFSFPIISCTASSSTFTPTASSSTTGRGPLNRHWMVCMEFPSPPRLNSKSQVIDYYVTTLQTVLGSESDAQVSIYHASQDGQLGFCCDIDEQASRQLARVPGVLLVRPDPDYESSMKDYSSNITSSLPQNQNPVLFPLGTTKHWLVRVDKPGVAAVTKAQMVDYYTQILTKVMGNEKDAQMCIYDVSWQSNFGFCCELDEECAREVAGLPGVLSIQLDENFSSNNKNYGDFCINPSTTCLYGARLFQNPPIWDRQTHGVNSISPADSSEEASQIDTKKLFIAGLSFYTSEKTLRAAFEEFGEIVEVKIIMDKISKRSKGYGFVEYTTEEAASRALKEMNGKIINGWMIVVDVAKITPLRNNRQIKTQR